MTAFQAMKDFFFNGFFSGIPGFLMSEPIIYFVSIFVGICILGMLVQFTHFNRR